MVTIAAPSHSRLVARLYEAAIGAEPWDGVIEAIARASHAATGIFYDFDRNLGRSAILGAYNLDPAILGEYEAHYSSVDIWHRRALAWPAGVVNGTHQLVSDDELLRSEFYNDHLRRVGIFYASGALVERTQNHASVFGIQRARKNGPFPVTQTDPLVRLMPHLRHAIKIHRRIREAERARDMFMTMLDRSTSGALLVDANARIVFANQSASNLLDRCDGLRLVHGKLAALRPQDSQRLLAAIRRAAGVKDSPPAGDSLLLPRPGLAPLSLLIAPLSANDSRRLAGIFIDVPAEEQPLDALARSCGLTAAETRLFMGIAAGRTLAEIAAANRVSTNTLRIQLGRVFDKTGTHRQADLVRFALNRTKPARV